jgi:hypothetical protein
MHTRTFFPASTPEPRCCCILEEDAGLPSVAGFLAPHLRQAVASLTATGIQALHGGYGGRVGDLDGVQQFLTPPLPPLAAATPETSPDGMVAAGKGERGEEKGN